MRLFLHLALAGLTATPTLAAPPEALPLTYETFDTAIPHADLAECPAALAQEDVFCRATLADDMLHVFAFSLDDNSPLVGFRSFELDSLPQLLN
tara:strand:- start:628 stop:909 length:282 start_codon:yes stop_codon:yes gene_type:complete